MLMQEIDVQGMIKRKKPPGIRISVTKAKAESQDSCTGDIVKIY
jgi:hypothetical protein